MRRRNRAITNIRLLSVSKAGNIDDMNPAARLSHLEMMSIESAGVGELAAGFAAVRDLRSWLDATEAHLARRQDVLAATIGARPAADALAQGRKMSRRAAERAADRAAVLGEAPEIERQLSKGNISAEHVDALTVAAKGLSGDDRAGLFDHHEELALAAAAKTPEQFGRHVRRTIQQLSDDDGVEVSERQRDQAQISLGINEATGMGEIRGELHPDDWQKVNRRIDAEVAALRKRDQHANKTRAQLSAVALVNLITSTRTASRVPAEVVIHVGLDAINQIPGAPRFGEYSNGSPVPVAAIRRHACDANLIPVVLNGDGIALDVGRAQRLATPEQRTALRAMYRTCAVDGCSATFDRCEVHHTLEWTHDQGPTDLDHLIPICTYHHHRFHEGRWRHQLDPDTRELTIWYPDGTLHSRSRPDITEEHTQHRQPDRTEPDRTELEREEPERIEPDREEPDAA